MTELLTPIPILIIAAVLLLVVAAVSFVHRLLGLHHAIALALAIFALATLNLFELARLISASSDTKPTPSETRSAFLVAHAASLIYEPPESVAHTLSQMKVRSYKIIIGQTTGMRVLIGTMAFGTLIVFRGTETSTDWLQNIKIAHHSTPFGDIHLGFKEAWADVKDDVMAFIRDLAPAGEHLIWLGGHSLGGATAIVAGLDLHADLPSPFKVRGIYTFGQPRVMSSTAILDDVRNRRNVPQIHRYVATSDIIPRVPPTWFGFTHIGHRMWIGGHDDDFFTAPFSLIAGHSLRNYISYLTYALQKDDAPCVRETVKWIEDRRGELPVCHEVQVPFGGGIGGSK